LSSLLGRIDPSGDEADKPAERDGAADDRQDGRPARRRHANRSGVSRTGTLDGRMRSVSRWITRVEAAELLGLSPSGVGFLVGKGLLTPRRMGSRQLPSLDERQVRVLAAGRLVEEQRARDRKAEAQLRTRHPPGGYEWLTAAQVSRLLGISRVRVDQLARRGSLPFEVGPGGRRSFRADHVELVRRARDAARSEGSGGAAGDEAGS